MPSHEPKPLPESLTRSLSFLGRRLRRFLKPQPVVAAVRLSGVIGHVGHMQRGITLDSTAALIKRAFEQPRLKAVVLLINSPGGSPVQSSLIAQRIRHYAEQKKKVPVLAFVEDVAASGGYWLACAADEIYAQEASVLGSIGVVSAGFGFQEALAKLGIERRVHTKGKHKAILDPFLPEKKEDVAILEHIQGEIHSQFKTYVKSRRGKKLKGAEEKLFSGLFWVGTEAKKLGLIDGIDEVRTHCEARFGKKIDIRLVRPQKPLLQQILNPRMALGAENLTEGLVESLEARSLWQRYGL
jgi:serine protease SohB